MSIEEKITATYYELELYSWQTPLEHACHVIERIAIIPAWRLSSGSVQYYKAIVRILNNSSSIERLSSLHKFIREWKTNTTVGSL